ncbi:hypothetical protein IAT38_000916 [Cryptococcus sp. DSM 104549]
MERETNGECKKVANTPYCAQVELTAFRRALQDEARKELAAFQQTLASESQKEANAFSTRLEKVESELKTTKAKLAKARSETEAVKAEFCSYRKQHNYTKLIRAEIIELGESVSAILNRDALEKESDCVEAFGKFMWNTLRDAIPQTPELLCGTSELDHADQSSSSQQSAMRYAGDSHGAFNSSYDDNAAWVRGTSTGHWAVPPEHRNAYLEATARIISANLPIDARTRISTRVRDPILHHRRHRAHLNNLEDERPLLFDHLAEGGAGALFYHDLYAQHRLTDLGDPITLLDYLMRLERVGANEYRAWTLSDLSREPRAGRVREMLAAMGPECATHAVLALQEDPATPHIPFEQLQSLQDYFGDGYDILIKGEDEGWTPTRPEIELCG